MQNNQESLGCKNSKEVQEQDSETIAIPQNWQQIASNQIKLLELDYLRTLQADGKSNNQFEADNSEVEKLDEDDGEQIEEKDKKDKISDDDQDEEDDDLQQYGYQQLDMDNDDDDQDEDTSQNNQAQEIKKQSQPNNNAEPTTQSPYKDLDVKMTQTSQTSSNKSLSVKQIKNIQESMSKLDLKAPQWAKGLSDKDFLKLLKEKQSKFNKIN